MELGWSYSNVTIRWHLCDVYQVLTFTYLIYGNANELYLSKWAVCEATWLVQTLIAWFIWPTWGPSVADRTQVGPMLAPWTLLSGRFEYFARIRLYTEFHHMETEWQWPHQIKRLFGAIPRKRVIVMFCSFFMLKGSEKHLSPTLQILQLRNLKNSYDKMTVVWTAKHIPHLYSYKSNTR